MKNYMPFIAICLFFALLLSGCAGTNSSKFTYNNTYKPNMSVNDEKCYDSSVMLNLDIKSAKAVAKKVLTEFDTEITEETDTAIKADRIRRYGNGGGACCYGGEELGVNLQQVDANNTFITVTTKTGWRGYPMQGGSVMQIYRQNDKTGCD